MYCHGHDYSGIFCDIHSFLKCKILITRLLGRPQPQMYPPVALNQYTLVNRTHKNIICFKAPQTS